jgi:hypothetical protein
MLVNCRIRSKLLAPRTLAFLSITSRSCSTTLSVPALGASPLWKTSRLQRSKVYQSTQIRGAKRKTVIDLDNLPQGAIDDGFEKLPPQDDEASDYPPLLQQVHNNMLKFSHCVVVTRVGGFYEVGTNLHS